MKVGIFWYYDGAVIGSAHALEHGYDAGEFIDSPVNHVTYWPLIQRQISCLRHTEYQEVPRGRALHDKTKLPSHDLHGQDAFHAESSSAGFAPSSICRPRERSSAATPITRPTRPIFSRFLVPIEKAGAPGLFF